MPSIEKVIEVHKQLLSVSDAPLTIITEILWIFFTVLFVAHLIKDKKTFSLQGLIFSGFFLVILLSILSYLSFTIKEYDFSMNEKQWKENYVTPYLKSLPEHRKYVEDFSQLLTNDEDAIKSIYINDKEKPILVK